MRSLRKKKRQKRKKETGALEWLAQGEDSIKAFLKRDELVNIKAEISYHWALQVNEKLLRDSLAPIDTIGLTQNC